MTGWEAVASTGSSGEWHLGPDALQRETELAAPEQATVGAGRGTTPEANGTEETSPVGSERDAPYRTASPSRVRLQVEGKGVSGNSPSREDE